MPTRLIREGLMESEAVLSLPVEGRWLFVTIMLSADDLGIFEATEFKLARRADVNRDLARKLLSMLNDADLVRLYEVDGRRFGIIPKFRQRLQIKFSKHPLPPIALVKDDPDALNKINHLASKTTVGQPLSTVGQPSEAKAKAYKYKYQGTDVPLSPTLSATSSDEKIELVSKSPELPACPTLKLLALFAEHCPDLPHPRRELWDGSAGAEAMRQRWKWLLTSKRQDETRYAFNIETGLEWFARFFKAVNESDLLAGRVGKWRADLAWLMKRENFAKVVQGNYVNNRAEA